MSSGETVWVVPVAGKGTRMRPITYALPKALIPLRGAPVLKWVLDPQCLLARETGMLPDRLVLVLSPDMQAWIDTYQETIREVFAGVPSPKVEFAFQNRQEGTAHAIASARPWIQDADHLWVIFGDAIMFPEAKQILAFPEADAYLLTFHVDDPSSYGVVRTDSSGTRIFQLVEKPEKPISHQAIAGVYIIRRNVKFFLSLVDELLQKGIRGRGNEYHITTVLQWMVDRGKWLVPVPVDGWYDTGNPREFFRTLRAVFSRLAPAGEMQVHKTARVEDSRLIPPVWIGPHAKVIRSTVGPFVALEKDTMIQDSHLEECEVMEGTWVLSSSLNRSIVGAYSRIDGIRGSILVCAHSVLQSRNS